MQHGKKVLVFSAADIQQDTINNWYYVSMCMFDMSSFVITHSLKTPWTNSIRKKDTSKGYFVKYSPCLPQCIVTMCSFLWHCILTQLGLMAGLLWHEKLWQGTKKSNIWQVDAWSLKNAHSSSWFLCRVIHRARMPLTWKVPRQAVCLHPLCSCNGFQVYFSFTLALVLGGCIFILMQTAQVVYTLLSTTVT